MSEVDSNRCVNLRIFPGFICEEIFRQYPEKLKDLQMTILVAVILSFTRMALERYILFPLGRYYGLIAPGVSINKETLILEKLYSIHGKEITKVNGLIEKTGWSERQIDRWLRNRSRRGKWLKLQKFAESGWRFLFYLTMHIYCVYILIDKSWLWNTADYFQGYPYQDIPSNLRWFYVIEMGYYFSATVFHLIETKRKDYKMMLIHHIFSLLILWASWISLFFRIGSVVLLLYDIADIFLEFGKMCKYIGKQHLLNVAFVCFIISWFGLRIIIFLFRVLYPSFVDTKIITPDIFDYFGCLMLIGLAFISLLLNIIWSFMIVEAVKKALSANKFEASDARSESEMSIPNSSSDDDDDDEIEQNHLKQY